jgi:hypothetical protein
MYRGCVYEIRNKVDGKRYIGRTAKELYKRIYEHKANMKRERYQSLKLYQALNEYGFDQFIVSILEEVESEDKKDLIYQLDYFESLYIDLFNSIEYGYNSTTGGTYYKYDERTKEKMRLANESRLRKVDVYSMNGEFIKTYDSVQEASKDFNSCSSAISHVCNSRYRAKSHKGFRFAYHNEKLANYRLSKIKPTKEKGLFKRGGVEIQQIDRNGNVINTFTSMIVAAKETGLFPQGISQCCRGVIDQYNGTQWRYKEVK